MARGRFLAHDAQFPQTRIGDAKRQQSLMHQNLKAYPHLDEDERGIEHVSVASRAYFDPSTDDHGVVHSSLQQGNFRYAPAYAGSGPIDAENSSASMSSDALAVGIRPHGWDQKWQRIVEEKRGELQLTLHDVEFAMQRAELLFGNQIVSEEHWQMGAAHNPVLLPRRRRLLELRAANRALLFQKRLPPPAPVAESAARREIARARNFSLRRGGGSGDEEEHEAVEVQRSLDKVQRELTKQQTSLRVLRDQIAECESGIKRSQDKVQYLAHIARASPYGPREEGKTRTTSAYARPRLPPTSAAAAAASGRAARGSHDLTRIAQSSRRPATVPTAPPPHPSRHSPAHLTHFPPPPSAAAAEFDQIPRREIHSSPGQFRAVAGGGGGGGGGGFPRGDGDNLHPSFKPSGPAGMPRPFNTKSFLPRPFISKSHRRR